MIKWACGVTTVPSRGPILLLTLNSILDAGFPVPRVFMDQPELAGRSEAGSLGVFGNWCRATVELYIRNPEADRYVLFQDDIILCRNVRQYLESVRYLDQHYWNLYTSADQVKTCDGFQESRECESGKIYHGKKQQGGRGALALVFSREVLQVLLASMRFVRWSCDPVRGHQNLDGVICESLNEVGYRELVHFPGLVEHRESVSTVKDKLYQRSSHFAGEQFDALQLLSNC